MSSILAKAALICHPDTPCAQVLAIGATISLADDHGWTFAFDVIGDPSELAIPAPAPRVQTDGLWQTTCFELFLAQAGDSYVEMNLSPSGAFAAYHFDHYRTGMRAIPLPAPVTTHAVTADRLSFEARLPEDDLPWDRTGRLGISVVIEARDGSRSYWALAHPPGRPDFHHRDCFALKLPPKANQ